jgi:hypothetical protein
VDWWFNGNVKMPTPWHMSIAILRFLEDRQNTELLTVATNGIAIHRSIQQAHEVPKRSPTLVLVDPKQNWTTPRLTIGRMLDRLFQR